MALPLSEDRAFVPSGSSQQAVSPVPASIPSADLLTMNPEQCLVLDRMDTDLGYPFRDIAQDCGLTECRVQAIIRHFHAMGMTGFGPLCNEDEPRLSGKGYWLLRSGHDMQTQMQKMLGSRALDAMRDNAQAVTNAKRWPKL